MSLDGAGSLLFPRRSGAISATAVPWVTEGDPAPVLQFVLDSATLDSAKKLVAIVVMTRELMEHTSANVVMRRLLAENVAAALDASLFSNVASSTSRPAGILNGVSALTAATAGAGAMATDLSALAKAIAPVTTGLVFVAHPAQAAMINLNRGVTYPNVEVWPTLGVSCWHGDCARPGRVRFRLRPRAGDQREHGNLAAHGGHDAVADRDRRARLGCTGDAVALDVSDRRGRVENQAACGLGLAHRRRGGVGRFGELVTSWILGSSAQSSNGVSRC